MIIQILDRAKKKKIIEEIEELGITKIRELLIKTGSERIRAFSGSLSVEEIMSLWRILPFEGIGLYVGKESMNKGTREVRLSVDGLHIWKEQITNNILILTEEQERDWFRGKNIALNDEQKKLFENLNKFVAVKSWDGKDFIGTGKIGEGGILYGYLPKERRRKSQEI